MKATLNKKELLNVLSKMAIVVPKKSTMPICTNILIKVGGAGIVTIRGTDLENEVTMQLPGYVALVGAQCIPPIPLAGFCNELAGDEIKMEYDKKKAVLVFSQGKDSIALPCKDPKDYPAAIEVATAKGFVIPKAKESFAQVSYASATEDSRPILNTVNIRPAHGGLALAAADGFRLAIHTMRVQPKPSEQFCINRSTVAAMTKMLKNGGSVRIATKVYRKPCVGTKQAETYISAFYVTLYLEGLILSTRAVLGTFPAYEKLIPTKGNHLTVAKKDLLKAIRVAASIKPDGGIIRLKSTGGTLVVDSHREQDGDVKVKSVAPCRGKIQTAFNDKYVLEAVSLCPDKIKMLNAGTSSPTMFDAGNTVHIVMPMFVHWE